MGIYIRGMEMPTEDEEIFIRIDSSGTVMTQYALPISGTKAIHVPPHGRLIDADALEDNNITYYAIPVLANVTDAAIREAELVIRLKDLDNAPTIIQAEQKGE